MAAVVFGALLLSIAFTIGLYLLIESETSNPTVVDRETAEREAKKQGGLRRHSRRSDRRVGDDPLPGRGRSEPEANAGDEDRTEERNRPNGTNSSSDDRDFGWENR